MNNFIEKEINFLKSGSPTRRNYYTVPTKLCDSLSLYTLFRFRVGKFIVITSGKY